jgi:hypothetical protein
MTPLEGYTQRNRPRFPLPPLAPEDFRSFMFISIGIATASFAIPLLWLRLENSFSGVLFVAWPLSAFWTVQLRWAVKNHGKRRLWGLLGLPFVFFWHYVIIALPVACALGRGCL